MVHFLCPNQRNIAKEFKAIQYIHDGLRLDSDSHVQADFTNMNRS